MIAAALSLGAPQAWAQVNELDKTAQDQTAADPEGSTQIQSSQPQAVDRSAADQGVDQSQIVVTGTILRGAPPVGSNLISIGEDRIQTQGATTANELLATVPQVSNLFNNVPASRLATNVNQVQVVRPNLRNLAPETASSASTLVLFDGHRIASVGVTQNAVDPDLIPSIAIERVEVVTDGGSATYGADAVGGVINFITRKRFDGLQVQARYGFADDYYQVEAGAMAGKDWGSGSLYAAYNYQHNDAIFGRDRDFIRDVDFLSSDLTPRGRSCTPGNVQFNVSNVPTSFALNAAGAPLATVGSFNACDPTDDVSRIPQSTRHGALAGLHQELADWLTVDLRAFYGERSSISLSPFRGSVSVTGGSSAANPRQAFYTPVPGQNQTINQTVFFTLAPLLGVNSAKSTSEFQEWGANAEFRADLNDNWSLRTLFNYSRSNSEYSINQISPALATQFGRATTPATAINFYNPGAGVNDLANIQQLINNEDAGQGKESLFNARSILDGALFTLPGGDVKLAVGYEYMHDGFQQRFLNTGPIGTVLTRPFRPYSRRVHSAFAEVQVPIVGAGNRMGFIHSLTLAGSIRHDDFSDVGSTTNPKIGVNFKPVSWLGFRGNYSTSFNAPAPIDQLNAAQTTSAFSLTNAPFVRPGDVPSVIGLVSLRGALPGGLEPQTAKTYSFGVDIDPPFIEGLRASANYYNVKFKNIIRQPSPNTSIYTNFPGLITSDPAGLTLGQITDFLNAGGAVDVATTLGQVTPRCGLPNGRCNVYAIIDFRTGNYGTVEIEGLDFSASYRRTTGFGGIDAGLSGNYLLSRKTQTGIGAPIINEFDVGQNTSRLQLQATLGADVGTFRAQATLNHSSGFEVLRCDPTTVPACRPSTTGVPTQAGLPQSRTGDFNTVNLFFKYEVPSESQLLRNLSFTLNVNNVFDEDPPLFQSIGASSPGFINGFTLGRLVQFGVQKKF
ncbi:MAG: TonB-dependent receptor [Novosphingobium sp.]|nr:TonB-dependent receptor [Novosphingobium sp.]